MASTDGHYAIYALVDPPTQQVRYVGATNRPDKRRHEHRSQANRHNSRKDRWIRSLDGPPIQQILEWVEPDEWEDAERYWIRHFRGVLGPQLLNEARGGRGGWSDAARAQAMKKNLGRPKPLGSGGTPPIRRGSKSNLARLDEAAVLSIRRLNAEGLTSRQLAAQFNVTPQNIWCVVSRKSWAHV